jgi:hypothetical protein
VVVVLLTERASDIRGKPLLRAVIAMIYSLLTGDAGVVKDVQVFRALSALDAAIDWLALLAILNTAASAGAVAEVETNLASDTFDNVLPLNFA